MVTITYPIVAKPAIAEYIFTLRGVTWPTYKSLMADFGDGRPWRIAYDEEILELRMPLFKHEKPKRLIDNFV